MFANDESDSVCVVRRVIKAAVDVVYRAWTDPVLVARWSWGRAYETISIEQDCRAGGSWRQHIRNKETGENWFFDGLYQEVVPCKKLVHSFHWRSDRGEEEGPSLVSIEFLERGASTEVVITHSLLPAGKKKGTQSGWVDVLDGVEDCLTANC
jgi:uncharacterized protein YndB with AHSA1/START domain